MKKILSLSISLIMILMLFAGCGGAAPMMAENSSAAAAPMAAPAANSSAEIPQFAGGLGFARDSAEVQEEAIYDIAPAAEMPAPDGGVAGPTVNPVIDSRKIIKNIDMRLQTQAFDTSAEQIPQIAESFGGFVQDSYIEGRDMYNERGTRSANFTIRIPVEKLDSFVNSVGSSFHVTSKSQNSQDITESYYDSKARLDALRIQEQRLLEMLKQAAELEYLLQVEKELMSVRYEIESLTSSLNRMDSYVSMSTVTIYLQEVIKYEPVEDVPVTFGERISRAFSESWKNFGEFSQDFAVWFVAAFPALLVIAIIAFIIITIIRKGVKKGEAKRIKNFQAHMPFMPSVPPMPSAPPASEPIQQPPTEEDNK